MEEQILYAFQGGITKNATIHSPSLEPGLQVTNLAFEFRCRPVNFDQSVPVRAKCHSGGAARDSVRSSSKTVNSPLVIRSRMRGGTGSAEPKLATADTGNTGAGTELPPAIPGATVVGKAAVGAGERTPRRSSMRS